MDELSPAAKKPWFNPKYRHFLQKERPRHSPKFTQRNGMILFDSDLLPDELFVFYFNQQSSEQQTFTLSLFSDG
jgi:hypothetical protein